jgi:hypothetical protein
MGTCKALTGTLLRAGKTFATSRCALGGIFEPQTF